MDQSPLLSVCMIVKDEEKTIARCLESIRGITEDIIIVDTGSKDQTKEICDSLGVHTIDFLWTESFAEARNFGLEKATGKFILWIDADEVLEVEDLPLFLQTLRETDQNLLLIPLVNFVGSEPDENNAYLFASHRLLRTSENFRFHGCIHERLDLSGYSGPVAKDIELPVRILHYGYLDNVVEVKNKSARNLQMLELERNSPEYSPWTDYHAASEYYRQKNYEKAFAYANAAIGFFIKKGQLPSSLVYKLKYDILLTGGSYDEAWPGIEKAIEIYPDYADLWFYKGLILLAQKKYEKATRAFNRCIMVGDGGAGYLTLKGTGSFHALHFLGVCYEKLGYTEQAKDAYAQALAIFPGYIDVYKKFDVLPIYNEIPVQTCTSNI